jgi:hypothetical protein
MENPLSMAFSATVSFPLSSARKSGDVHIFPGTNWLNLSIWNIDQWTN